MNAERNDDRLSLAGFIRRTREALIQDFPQMGDWRRGWDGIAEDFWRFSFSPRQAAEAIAESEGIDVS